MNKLAFRKKSHYTNQYSCMNDDLYKNSWPRAGLPEELWRMIFERVQTGLVFVLRLNTILGFQCRASTRPRLQTFKIHLEKESWVATPIRRNLVSAGRQDSTRVSDSPTLLWNDARKTSPKNLLQLLPYTNSPNLQKDLIFFIKQVSRMQTDIPLARS